MIDEGLLIDNHFAREIDFHALPTSIYGPIELNKLDSTDFIKCDNEKLDDCFNTYWSDRNWGGGFGSF